MARGRVLPLVVTRGLKLSIMPRVSMSPGEPAVRGVYWVFTGWRRCSGSATTSAGAVLRARRGIGRKRRQMVVEPFR